jgi:hypothetical protein
MTGRRVTEHILAIAHESWAVELTAMHEVVRIPREGVAP